MTSFARPFAVVGLLALLCAGCAYLSVPGLNDPSPGISQTKAEARNLECIRLSQAKAHELYPGKVPEVPPRGAYQTVEALTCNTRIIDLGDRPARDEAVLSALRQTVAEITHLATAVAPEQTLWHVDAFYPQPVVAQKISVATRINLAERGHRVSDRVPILAAGDITVLSRLSADKAYPLACARYFKEQALVEPDAFLGLMVIDAREIDLHAGLCLRGEWKWLR